MEAPRSQDNVEKFGPTALELHISHHRLPQKERSGPDLNRAGREVHHFSPRNTAHC